MDPLQLILRWLHIGPAIVLVGGSFSNFVVFSVRNARKAGPGPKRLIWCVNHRTLMQSEVPILRSLGWEVFIPKVIPTHDSSYRSAAVSYEFDATLSIPEPELRILNAIPFYEDAWSPTSQATRAAGWRVRRGKSCRALL